MNKIHSFNFVTRNFSSGNLDNLLFRQLFDHISSTYTYLLGCVKTKECLLIDPVLERVRRDFQLTKDLGLKLKYAVNTHMHADHVTGTGYLRALSGCKTIISKSSGAQADIFVDENDEVVVGHHKLKVLSTPGHTNGCITYYCAGQRLFSQTPPPRQHKTHVLKYIKAIPGAFTPTKGSSKAAGYDLKSIENITVQAKGKAIINTGLKIELPEGSYGRIAPRSGLTVKKFLDVGAGVIDEDYRGLVKVVLFNHSEDNITIQVGDRIAQLICEKIFYPELEEVQDLSPTIRNENGFGST